MDIWVDKTKANYEFLGSEFNVWGFGREPNRIEIMSEVKGLVFDIAYQKSRTFKQGDLEIRFIDFGDLLQAKKAAGRFKDKNHIEQLNKKKKG
jgi:hypothetical protein